MSRLTRLVQILAPRSGRDEGFESYYGSILLTRQDGTPSAEEARRDFEPVRRIMDRAVIF
ncbi:hypothetical protein [Sphaerobacter thermophilus]|jgi:hypothetical protein|uniref:Uncharacterized protein n=1 Tax=Sphaerobacter thermophilus (strain ATCC 49802 / DSM 20745 / KCCM 41009 / NCIMB 13125 / S 6022) TaxID=479434 RepID=D1C526_SPHTD|nr:hypothetical protein [Sphaerobacter thermophilus]ACZ39343.1 hypothetical protein Sthe_1911 [Sphaerobacter thermophilus DSM 20745]PZN60982.1 MAG: hypothetical protein DIU58_14815 [Sphaerobacter thermophilus]